MWVKLNERAVIMGRHKNATFDPNYFMTAPIFITAREGPF